jgi:sortase A
MERATSAQEADETLLATLLEAPSPSVRPLRPARLRSLGQRQSIALEGYRLRTWVDCTLGYAERALLVAALLAFGFWLVDGPVRDWLYTRSAQPVVAAPAQPTAQRSAAQSRAARGLPQARPAADKVRQPSLPFVTDAAHSEGERAIDAFLAPGYTPPGRQNTAPQPQRLAIPAIGLDTPIVETFLVDGMWQVAEYAAGYMSGTALPGEGNTALSGHAGLRGAVFRDLGRLRPGDVAVLEAGGWRYEYRVREALTVWPTQVEVLDPTPTSVLTLITCVTWDTQRLVVVADLVSAVPIAEE